MRGAAGVQRGEADRTRARGRVARLRDTAVEAWGAAVVCGLAAWVSLGVLAVTADSRSPRVGILPPWWVPVAVAAVVAAAATFARVPARAWRTCWFPSVLLLPWLPLPVPPVFLLWSGPIAAWVWIATGVAFLVAAWPDRSTIGRAPGRWLVDPRRAWIVALVVAFAIECAAAWRLAPVLPAGDEPHYLIITQSLLQDGDLRIENNHRQRDYASYFPGFIRPDYLRRGKDRQIYSIHAPGLSVLVAPAFVAGSYRGVTLFLALLSALGGALLWRLAFGLTRSAAASWFGWAGAVLSTPFFFHAFRAYPDGTGAVLILVGLAALVRLDAGHGLQEAPSPAAVPADRPSRRLGTYETLRWVLYGSALAVLPWLHTRYAAAAALLGIFIGVRLLQRRRFVHLAAFLGVPIVSAVAWFGFFYAIYGEFDPAAPYGHYTQSAWSNVPHGLAGLLLDQQFGMLPYAPVLAFAIAGIVAMVRRTRRLGIELTVLVVSYLTAAAAYHMWWGGTSAPARFAVPVVLALGVPAAVAWRAWPRARAAAVVALVLTILATGSQVLARDGTLLFNARDGFARWLAWLSPLVDLPRAFPSFLRENPGPVAAQTAIWVALFVAAAAVLCWMAARPETTRPRLAGVAPWLFALALTVGAAGSWLAASVVPITPTSAQLGMLHAAGAGLRPVGVAFRPLAFGTAGDVLCRLRVSNDERRPPARNGAPLLMVVDVPAGIYRLKPSGLEAREGTLEMRIGRSVAPSERWSAAELQGGANALIRLPVGANAVTVTGNLTPGPRPMRLALQPTSILPLDARTTAERARRAARYGSVVVFSFGEEVFLEEAGLWVSGAVDERIVVASDSPREAVAVLLRNGAEPNTLRLKTGGEVAVLAMQPNEERIVPLHLNAADGTAALLEIHADRGYRPSEVDPRSKDQRYLGVWIEVEGGTGARNLPRP